MAERYTKGYPSCCGSYDCKLEDGRIEIVNYDPWFDSEIHPYGELLEVEILAFRRIPGQRYIAPERNTWAH